MKPYKNWEKKPGTASDLLEKIRSHIRLIVPNADIILYGSRARDEAGEFSDWDFLTLIDQPVSADLTEKIRNAVYEIELESDEILSVIVRSRRDWHSPKYSVLPFKRAVENEGVIL
ncbi:conserved hypothetical protein [Candidatus Desulfarcum epimagneticum]|uniref:Polymerase nucleotidyl transferase domain-containing protein n=1 Tax=uncultured Desulfobacteraceae bacterium TaxID=218296 RepID=A0A484HMX2_9BACT|nr:conserved hypothetical protein [uncultured Desulfobacteraceae bacterium]